MRLEFKERECTNPKTYCGIRIWEKPKSTHVYAIGADVAEGVGRDASVAQVIDCKTGALVANYWSNTVDVDNYAAELFKLANYYNKAHLCIEDNNHGAGIIAHLGGALGGMAYTNLYKRLFFDEFTQRKSKKIGFKTTRQTKPRIIENLKSALRDGSLIVFCKDTILELSSFVRDEKTGNMAASGTGKDDRVMALALAWEQARLLRELNTPDYMNYAPKTRFDETTGFPILG